MFSAACFRAHRHVKERTKVLLDAMKRGHLPLKNDIFLLGKFTVEVAYEGVKYVWQVSAAGRDRPLERAPGLQF